MKTDRPSIVTDDVLGGCARPTTPDRGARLDPHTPGGCVVSGSTDWFMAVRVAAARLEEHFGTLDHPVVATLANDLAALLCAYGMIDDEHARMRARQAFTVFAQSGSGPSSFGKPECGQSESTTPETLTDRQRRGPRRNDGAEPRQTDPIEEIAMFRARIAEYL